MKTFIKWKPTLQSSLPRTQKKPPKPANSRCPTSGTFYKTAYSADCDDADPDNLNPEITDGIIWTINISLRSAGLIIPPGGL